MKKFLLSMILIVTVACLNKAIAQPCSISNSSFRVTNIVSLGPTCNVTVEVSITYVVNNGNKWLNVDFTSPVVQHYQQSQNLAAGTRTSVFTVTLTGVNCAEALEVVGTVWLSNSNGNTSVHCSSPGVVFATTDPRVDAASVCGGASPQVSVTLSDNSSDPNALNSGSFKLYYDNGSTPGQFDGTDQLFHSSGTTTTFPYNPGPVTVSSNNVTVVIVASVTSTVGTYSVVNIHSNSCITLPVSLKGFTAQRTRSTVGLNWTTSAEQQNSGFEIQRLEGDGAWKVAAFVPSKALNGTSGSDLSYSFTETNLFKGVSQYRLKQVDLNGTHKFSEIRFVAGEEKTGKTVVYPNPTRDGKVNVVFDGGKGVRDVSLLDMNGRIIKQWKSLSSSNLQIDNLNQGIYNLRVVTQETGEVMMEKIVVNNR